MAHQRQERGRLPHTAADSTRPDTPVKKPRVRIHAFEAQIGQVNVCFIVPHDVAHREWSLGSHADFAAVRTQAIAHATRLLGEKTALSGETWSITFSFGKPPAVQLLRGL